MPSARGVETAGVRGRIQVGMAFRKRRADDLSTRRAEMSTLVRKTTVKQSIVQIFGLSEVGAERAD